MQPAPPDVVRRSLAAVRVWPPALPTGRGPDPRLRPLAELAQPREPAEDSPDPEQDRLAQRVCERMGRSGEVPLRVGRSAVVMGVASRLWSLTVVPAVRDGVLVDPEAIGWWDDDGSVTLGVTEPRGGLDPDVDDVAAAIAAVLDPIVTALPMNPRLLWGNVAASLHAVPRVHALPQAQPLVADLLGRTPLAGELDELPGGRARRRTCCLFYLVPGGGLCGDCVLDAVPGAARGGIAP